MFQRSRLRRRNVAHTTTVLIFSIALGGLSAAAYAEEAKKSGAGDLAAASQDPSSIATSHADLAKKATDPSAILTQLQLQNIFVPSSNNADGLKADGYANTFIIQPVIPIAAGDDFPLDLVIRPTLPIVTTPEFKLKSTGATVVNDTTGLGDLVVLAPLLKNEKWGKWGAGPTFTFPTATDKRTGASKWQAGPTAIVIYNGIDKWTVGGVA